MAGDIDALLAASRAIGRDESLVVWGGGNSSVKSVTDSFRGRRLRSLHVKGSGSDMKTLQRGNLAVLDLEAILELRHRNSMSDEAMVAYLASCQIEPGPRPSIETLLHAFLPAKFVLHTHADATAALVDNPSAGKHVLACWKGSVALVPYQRPGFSLSMAALAAYAEPLQGIMLDKHGLITWGQTAAQALSRMRSLVGKAAAYVRSPVRRAASKSVEVPLATLRGALSPSQRQILNVDTSPEAVQFSLRQDAAKLCAGGPATPDHLLYTKPKALYIQDPSRIPSQVKAYRAWYGAYFKRFASRAQKGLVQMDSSPRIIVIRGFGMVSTGKDARQALVARDIFRHSMKVRRDAAGLGGYQAISLKQIFDFEYWPLENYKLSLAPPEKELSRRIAVVTGAARGIGKACALRLAQEGAHVALLDKDLKAARAVAHELGSQGLAISCDISDEASVKKAFEEVVKAWGGLDLLINNAGLATCASVDTTELRDWENSFAVNARGHFLCGRAAARIFKMQGIGGAMVFVSSKNVLSPGKDFAAYSASKAAQTQLAKVLALELAQDQVRVNCVMPDGVFEDSRLWDGIRESRAKAHGIRPQDLEKFYVGRNLLKRQVRPSDVAEAVLFLCSERSSRTTGSLLSVDGGVKDAFLR
jgi:rhamnulose-1-phosphate aldolase/alcohol dehydrogenase